MAEEYPRNLTELEANFGSEEACRAYLARLRWPEGVRCPRCGGGRSWPVRGVLLECGGCGCQTSVTAGTIFQDTRTPLPVWFRAMWWVTTQKNGASALGLQRGRIRMRRIPDASAASLEPFLQESVQAGSVVHTDGWPGYNGVKEKGYVHRVTVIRGSQSTASELMPRVHRVVSLLKRWLMGTHQGAVSHKHLDYYLDECTFRFNRRKSKSRGKLFFRLVQQAVAIDPVPLDTIIHPGAKVQIRPQHIVAHSAQPQSSRYPSSGISVSDSSILFQFTPSRPSAAITSLDGAPLRDSR